MIPHKKPRGQQFPPEQKQENGVISGIRITVEHAIGGIKRFASMSNVYRNKHGQYDTRIYLCAGRVCHKDCVRQALTIFYLVSITKCG
jgi:hypothetical protein